MIRTFAVLMLLTSLAHADDDAKALYNRGVTAYQAKDYPSAVSAFHDAYELDPRPETLFAWAQAERLNGDCAHAIVHYRKFLDGRPPSVQAKAAQGQLERCERALSTASTAPPPAAEPAVEPTPPPPVAVEPPRAPPPAAPAPAAPSPTEKGSFLSDGFGDVLVGAGLAAAIAGGVLLATAGSPDGAQTYDDFQMRHDTAVTHQKFGVIALGVGAALVVGGITHWVIWSSGDETGVAVAGRF